MICAAYGENDVSHTTCKRRYQKFCQGDFSLEDEQRAARLQKIETDALQALLDVNSAETEKKLGVGVAWCYAASYSRTFTMEKI